MADEVTEEQGFFDLFDSYWFFNKTQNPSSKIHKNQQSIAETSLDFSAVPTIRSYSDHLLITSKQQQSLISDSPNSVLYPQTPELQTIFSGKEVKEKTILPIAGCRKSRLKENHNNNRMKKSYSKSLSELEFEELKGFMDLGFVFSEKDKDTNLVSIIPGLQRLGRDEKDEEGGSGFASRPYLSEAWEKNIREEASARSLRIGSLGNELEIKHQLKFWAHSVASSIVK